MSITNALVLAGSVFSSAATRNVLTPHDVTPSATTQPTTRAEAVMTRRARTAVRDPGESGGGAEAAGGAGGGGAIVVMA
jgi:hypothetical protein